MLLKSAPPGSGSRLKSAASLRHRTYFITEIEANPYTPEWPAWEERTNLQFLAYSRRMTHAAGTGRNTAHDLAPACQGAKSPGIARPAAC